MYEGSDAGTSTDFINQNVPEFAMTSNYESIVASSGSQKLCAFTRGMSPHQAALQNKYSDWSSLTQANFMLMFGHEIKTREFDTLASIIEVEFFYVDSNNIKQVKTLSINVWFKAGAEAEEYVPPVWPENDPNDVEPFEPNPYTLFYRTEDKQEIEGITDEKARSIARLRPYADDPLNNWKGDDSYTLVSRGYNVEKDYGWIKLNKPIRHVGGHLFRHYSKLVAVLAWPTEITSIGDEMFAMPKIHATVQRYIPDIPDTVNYIGYRAFYAFGLSDSLVLRYNSLKSYELNPSWGRQYICEIKYRAFSYNFISTVEFICDVDGDGFYNSGFSECTNLQEIKGAYHCIVLSSGFSKCTSLHKIDSPIRFHSPWEASAAFAGCSSLETVVLNKNTIFIGVVDELHQSYNVFYECSSLKSVYIEGDEYSATYGFSQNVFYGCTAVENFYCNSYRPPYIGAGNIWKKGAINPKTCKLYVPVGRKHAYNSKAQWGDFPLDNIIEYTPEQFEAVKQQLLAEQ